MSTCSGILSDANRTVTLESYFANRLVMLLLIVRNHILLHREEKREAMRESKRNTETVAPLVTPVPSSKPTAMETETVKKSPLSNGKGEMTKRSPKTKKGMKAPSAMEGSSGKKRKTAR